MIQLIEGAPGSGKSYFAMNYLVKFTEFDALYNEYVLSDDVLIITNIEGLKIRHWSLEYVLKDRSLADFFSIKNFEALQKKTGKQHIILVIDEAHEVFPSGYKDMSIYNFFAYHRHIGLDVILLTQGIDSLTKMFNPLLEYIVKATPRSKKVSKTFTYKYCDLRGKYLFSKVITAKKTVFGAYKSFRSDEHNKPKSFVLIWALIVVLVLGSGVAGMAYTVKSLGSGSETKKHSPVESPRKRILRSAAPLSNEPDKITEIDQPLEWRTYYLEGVISQGEKRAYLINGRIVLDSPRFRHFDSVSNTVEYFGKEIQQATSAPSRRERSESEPVQIQARAN